VSATASHSGAIDGVKVSVSGDPKDVTSAKIALQILRDAVGVKADVTGAATGAPKAAVNACYDAGDLAIGASADVDCTNGAVSKYVLAAQIVADDNTLAVVVADELSTVRGSWVAKVDADTSAGAEVVYGVKSKTASASVALAKKFSDACSGKVSVSSPLPVNGGVVDPVISLYTTGDVAAKTTGSVSFQTTAAMKYKWGVQFATKM
jgi:voltage-dependent anion channel protein 2